MRFFKSQRGAELTQPGSMCHGAVQDTTRHTIGPTQRMWLLQMVLPETLSLKCTKVLPVL